MPNNKKMTHNHGLGKALMNHRAKTKKLEHERELHTTAVYENKPISVTQESDLENFLNTAAMAGVDFTAVRQNVVIVNSGNGSGSNNSKNPFLLSADDQAKVQATHLVHKDLLRVPRRPIWSESTTGAQLDRLERDAFLEWRKGLADLSDNRSLLLTPFERNIEVWRQLWRVVERSQLIVQIVDARNPLRFRCEDLEKYVHELSDQAAKTLEPDCDAFPSSSEPQTLKTNLLLVNKSDLLTDNQRKLWAQYFDSQGIQYAFFSAADAVALQAIEELEEPHSDSDDHDHDHDENSWEDEEAEEESSSTGDQSESSQASDTTSSEPEDVDNQIPPRSPPSALTESTSAKYSEPTTSTQTAPNLKTKILTVGELEELFLRHAETHLSKPLVTSSSNEESGASKLVVGLVGYPNVGKSSTINALVGSKKVSVSSTPGKTKHFQTIHLSPEVILCDCPGLVFPQFASTKAELVCDGVLPIDQMREHTGPISLITQRIPKEVLEATYGLQLQTLPTEEGGDGAVTASEFLTTYAIARGAFTGGGGQGRPDESKVSRPILKDYVSAKLLYCEPPPIEGLTADEFNAESREMKLKSSSQRKLAPTTRVPLNSDTFVKGVIGNDPSTRQSSRSQALDRNFLKDENKHAELIKVGIKGRRSLVDRNLLDTAGDLAKLRVSSDLNLYSIDDHGNQIRNIDIPNHLLNQAQLNQKPTSSKKHFKRNLNPSSHSKGKKNRSGRGYDES
ncbi:hypothetical protein MJO28_004003 [Puccinia striiformis f. sp. tritici]|uniref:CP-type G domain-containing protein n=3 Tax=Puccinia striiformis TaxID=27350 RepID=A0A0L0VQR8_9BASI|nr:hypothetical protein Pst134EA_007364 [Puccinia striiformis f. sp. tritici]KAI9616962.1 hypothetical protein H4Q26_010599 [Puccinia striiformis f. sp. tritici PST-130]KNF01360.1 hypothetical protein PSTG_05460 [Puccinia striiformis f. sp. tritici PST-78]POW19867.1 hypothetical protein PSHT_04194 [Puccinia striiformis]KAH9460325.1 hypothetical protein Pst134EB_008504 [Puccinia striiformis f. sp. tritici]KAH9470098.1 hypothetical protein Pst134EA_007364 [Puccinia striiformis f. sp. tritici]